MKLIPGLAFLLAAASAAAQLPPAPPSPSAPRAAEGLYTYNEAQVPREAIGNEKAPPTKPQTGNTELADLLRKQTAAIQALNSKVNDLQARVTKLERGAR